MSSIYFMASVVIFLFGLGAGSFLNVLIYRIPRGESFVKGRSRCPSCRHLLDWKDTVPLISFFFLRKKCRYCLKKISWRYFGVEGLTAVVFLVFFWTARPAGFLGGWSFFFWLAIFSLLIVLLFIDFDYFIIPDKILLVLFFLGFLYQLFGQSILANSLAAAVAGIIFFLIFALTRGRGLGLGDVKFVALLGFLFGFPAILPMIYLALAGGLVWSVVLILFFEGRRETKLPFGSLLAGSAISFILFGKFFLPVLMPYIFRLYI